jgi:hypothetical protein
MEWNGNMNNSISRKKEMDHLEPLRSKSDKALHAWLFHSGVHLRHLIGCVFSLL